MFSFSTSYLTTDLTLDLALNLLACALLPLMGVFKNDQISWNRLLLGFQERPLVIIKSLAAVGVFISLLSVK